MVSYEVSDRCRHIPALPSVSLDADLRSVLRRLSHAHTHRERNREHARQLLDYLFAQMEERMIQSSEERP